MSERIEEIRESYKCLNTFDKEAGKREFTTEELKKVVSSQKNINDSIPYLLKELETKDFTIRSLEHNREVLSKELEEAQKETGLARLAYEGLQEECVSRGEYESLLNKHSTLSRSLHEAQQDLKLSKQLIELDTEAMNKDLVTISRLKKIANDALGCMVIMSAADNEHVRRIEGNLRVLEGRE